MRNYLNAAAATLLLVLFSSGCELLDLVDIEFNSDEQSANVVIEPNTAGTYVEQEEIVTTDIKGQIQDNGGSFDQLSKITISDITVSLVSGATNLDAFKSFEITIKADGLESKKIAWMDDVPAGVTSVEPNHTPDNLKDYIGKDTYVVTFIGELREDTTEDITLKISAHYSIKL
ncbi:MAG: hypothetical protein JXB34_15545 [Bacteroidales bacterium]|nr:hypothetical protein [Bacteroidales bacterium]